MKSRFILTIWASVAMTTISPAYIHVPPTTLPKICKDSHYIRVLKVEKFDKEKGTVVFKETELLKKKTMQSPIDSFLQVFRTDDPSAKEILKWIEKDKTVVMFSIEGTSLMKVGGIAYVFIDKNCYSLDYNHEGKFWAFIRAEPAMSICYYGEVAKLGDAVKRHTCGQSRDGPDEGLR